jgi:hypothetical protein
MTAAHVGFAWVGQSFDTCDVCGRPAWEHPGIETAPETPFGALRWRLWRDGEAEAIRAKWETVP